MDVFIPKDVLLTIYSYMDDRKDVAALFTTCKDLLAIISSKSMMEEISSRFGLPFTDNILVLLSYMHIPYENLYLWGIYNNDMRIFLLYVDMFDGDDYGYTAALKGNIDMINYLIENKKKLGRSIVEGAIMGGSLEVYKAVSTLTIPGVIPAMLWFHNNIYDSHVKLCIEHDRIEIMEYIFATNNVRIVRQYLHYAIEKGNLIMIKYFMKRLAILVSDLVIACRYDNIDIVKYIHKNIGVYYGRKQDSIKDDCFMEALNNGYCDIVKYLIKKGFDIPSNAVEIASDLGYLDIVKILIKNDAPIEHGVEFSENRGYFDITKYLIRNGGKINSRSLIYAIKAGRADMVRFLVRRKALITNSTVHTMLDHYNEDIVKYLVAYDERIKDYAIALCKEQNKRDILKVIRSVK